MTGRWGVTAVLMLLLSWTPLFAGSSPIRFRHLGLKEGLSQATVLTMYQDRRGFLWVGTEDGLNRFDGRHFKVYRYDENDPQSLPNDTVWSLAEDAAGDLWVGTEGGGVARWDWRTDRFHRVAPPAGQPGFSSLAVRIFHFDPSGMLWVGTRDAGVNRLNPKTGEVQQFRHDANEPASLSDDRVFAITSDSQGRLWVGTDRGLDRFDPAKGSFQHYSLEPGIVLPNERVRTLLADRDGVLWVGTFGGGLARVEQTTRRVTVFRNAPGRSSSLSNDEVRSLLLDEDHRLWVGTSAGLNLLDDKRGTFTRYESDGRSPSSLSDDHVMSLFQDRGGVIWVGTRNGGLHNWHPAAWSLGHRTRNPNDETSVSHNAITSFAEDRDGQLWVGTFGGGLNVMNRSTGEFAHLRQGNGANGPNDDRVMTLLVDADGAMWVGTYGGGLNRYDPATRRFTVFRNVPGKADSLSADAVSELFQDRQGRIWVATFGGGLNRFEPSTGTFVRYPTDPANSATLSSPRITSLAEDTQGRLWVGTDGGGLNRLDPATGIVQRFQTAILPSDAAAASVLALYIDASDTVWVGTRGGGVSRVDAKVEPATAQFERFTVKNGLASNVVYGIQPDGRGNLWMSTNNGLVRMDPRSRSFESFGEDEGAQASEFNFGASYRSPSGELFFGGINGFNAFRPERLERAAHGGAVVLTSVSTFGQPRATEAPAYALSRLDLGYQEDVVSLEFAALDFGSPDSIHYRYRLEGFDDRWIELGSLPQVTLTDLAAGGYVLRVQAVSDAGLAAQEVALAIQVEAPPWQRWWAYLIYGCLTFSCIFAIANVQRRKLAREAAYSRRLEREVQERTVELAERNTRLQELNTKLREVSLTDPMTGLRNRRFLFEHVAKDMSLIHRRLERDHAVRFDVVFMMIDLDGFKPVNDTYGHPIGDQLLLQVVQRLQRCMRPSDVLVRWGGDEFLLIAREVSEGELSALAESVREAVGSEPILIDEVPPLRVTCSIGFSCFPFAKGRPEGVPWEDVLAIADVALYAAKRGQRNAWVGLLGTGETTSMDLDRLRRLGPDPLEDEGQIEVWSSFSAATTLTAPGR